MRGRLNRVSRGSGPVRVKRGGNTMHLSVGNKLYSSWSMRPWLVLHAFDIPFDETVVPLDTPEFETYRAAAQALGASGTVPMLQDGDAVVWETMAIIEHVADRFADKAIWPADMAARAHARAIANEMHAGFGALRGACPMNFGKRFPQKDRGDAVARDAARIEALWAAARAKFGAPGGAGPFLYGAFSATDAMYAPVVARLRGHVEAVAIETRDD
ncbi:MAG: glutathione S-transferase, partial [Pseudomonadota bacterium]